MKHLWGSIRQSPAKWLAPVLMLLGLGLLLKGAYIPVKAQVAQWLLDHAWEQTLEGGRHRPWPWADTHPVAHLSVPRLGVEQVVLAGANGRVLAFAPGHISRSAPPGSRGNVVLSGHRDTHFSWLKSLQQGDEIKLQLPDGRQLRYAVAAQQVYHERDSWLAAPDAGSGLRLITCYPFDAVLPATEQRYVVDSVQF